MTIPARTHGYRGRLVWEGNRGSGTERYEDYGREYCVVIDGKPPLEGSADPAFRGRGDRHNPEDLLVAAIAACHMLTYLALCARRGIRVIAYEDDASGTATTSASGMRLDEVVLSPVVTIAEGADRLLAVRLHEVAHRQCVVAGACRVPIRHEPKILTAGATVDAAPAEPAGGPR